MQINRESNRNITPAIETNKRSIDSNSELEHQQKSETSEEKGHNLRAQKRFEKPFLDNGLSDENRAQTELKTGFVDSDNQEHMMLMNELRDLKAPFEDEEAHVLEEDGVQEKTENKQISVSHNQSETQFESPPLLNLDELLPPELPLLEPLSKESLAQKTKKEFQPETENSHPAWTKNNLSSLVQAQFKKQLTAWDASGILNPRTKQSKALVSQAQKLSVEILNTPGYKEMFFEKTDAELRDALADAVGQLKKNDPKFKQLKELTYQSLPKDKQAFVDAILTGLKAGLPKQIQNSGKFLEQIKESTKFVNKNGKQEEVNSQQLLNKSELMGAIEKRRDQKMSTEGLNALGKLDKARQEKDLKSAKTQIHAETQMLEKNNIQTILAKTVPGTELSEKDFQQLIKTAFGESKEDYSDEEVEQDQVKAENLIKATSDPKLIWTVTLRPEEELLDDLKLALHGKTEGLSLSQKYHADEILVALRQEGLKKLESQGFVSKRDSETNIPKEIKMNGTTYTHVKQLGQGNFGVAHLFETTDPLTKQKEQVVVKQFKKGDLNPETWFDNMQKEIRAHQHAMGPEGQGHENVLALKGVLFDTQSEGLGEFFTVTEVASKGELTDVSDKIDLALKNKALTPTTHELLKRSLLAQTMEGMKYVQSQRGMLHKDLKPQNIFVNAQGQVKIADFGLSHTQSSAKNNAGGSSPYMSPENASKFSNLRGKDNKNKYTDINIGSDVWSLGVMSRELLTGNLYSVNLENYGEFLDYIDVVNDTTRFGNDQNNRVYQKDSKETRLGYEKKVEVKKSGGLSGLFKRGAQKKFSKSNTFEVKSLGAYEKVINAMMHPDQNKRPTFEALSKHSLFADQILQEPKLQELLLAVLDNKSTDDIQKLSKEVEVLNKRLK